MVQDHHSFKDVRELSTCSLLYAMEETPDQIMIRNFNHTEIGIQDVRKHILEGEGILKIRVQVKIKREEIGHNPTDILSILKKRKYMPEITHKLLMGLGQCKKSMPMIRHEMDRIFDAAYRGFAFPHLAAVYEILGFKEELKTLLEARAGSIIMSASTVFAKPAISFVKEILYDIIGSRSINDMLSTLTILRVIILIIAIAKFKKTRSIVPGLALLFIIYTTGVEYTGKAHRTLDDVLMNILLMVATLC